jgi:hypothetical protein
MRAWAKIFVTLVPLVLWGICAAWFEWSWHGADPLANTGRGFGWVAVYRFGLFGALLFSALIGSFCAYGSRTR